MIARLWAWLCALALIAAIHDPAAASEPRVALVIGNSNYGAEIGKLKNPANDAKLMADTLKGLGFQVDLVLDADQKAMKRAVKNFGTKLQGAGKDATGLFYYAGHGVQVEGTNYLLPIGAEIEKESDVEIESISADDVMTQMQFAGNAVNLVFLDACRNNPLARNSRSATRGLARLDAPRGSFVGYSTAPGDVAADGDGANSPYALALVEELKKPGISIEEAHRNVRATVLAESGNKQTPWDSSSLTGPVVLQAKAIEQAPQPVAQPEPQPQAQQQASVDKEALFWETIKDSKDPAEFEAYLQQYPQGSFAPLAKAKIAALTPKPQTAPPAAAEPNGQGSAEVPQAFGSEGPPASAGTQVASATVPSSTTLAVSTQVGSDIDAYLRNAEAAGRFWALAIRKDGDDVTVQSCQRSGYQPCRTLGSGLMTQQRTNEEAIKKCGGASACILLYEGKRKVANLDLVVQ